MDFSVYKVGEPTGVVGGNGVIFDLTDSGGVLIIRLVRPTTQEMNAFKSGIRIKFVSVEGIIFALVKMGAMQWCDAPFYKGFSKSTHLNYPEEGQGLAINVFLIDGMDGILRGLKLISLTTVETKKLFDMVMGQPLIPDYDDRLDRIYTKYTTDDLVRIAH